MRPSLHHRLNEIMKKAIPAVLSFDGALSHEPADKRMDILRRIGESGSISQAAREAKVSYKAAWQAIDTLTNLAGVALLERAVGGSGGGGATLTLAGKKLLAIADLLSETRSQVLRQFRTNELLLPRTLPTLSNMGVRTSMRNQLPCRIEKIEALGQVVRVHLLLGKDARLVSRITLASAELLDLQKGQQVLALCKATAVVVEGVALIGTHDKASGAQRLDGQTVRVSHSKSGDEVSLQLDTGLQLVGFAAARSGLKVRNRVSALVDETAVVIALAN